MRVRDDGETSHKKERIMEFIDLKEQYRRYRAEIDQRIAVVLKHGHFIMGPEIAELEGVLAKYVGVQHCITVASGTASLEIALRALGIGPGDEVITVPFTWISSAEVIGLVGAKPVFVDIEPKSYNLDIERLEKAVTPRTRAIMPVSLFGQMPDYDRINAMAARHAIPVIEDGAQSFGATQQGRRSCGVTLIGSTSFFPAKPLGCYGDGGALFTNDDGLAEKMRAICTHGGLKRHHHPVLGMNGRFDTLQAAVLLAKMPHFQEEVDARGRIGARYTSLLSALCSSPGVMPGNTHVYAQYTIRVPNRDAVASKLKEQGIPTAVYYPKCLHEQPVFAGSGYQWGDFPEAEKASREVLSLPMHPFLTEPDQDRVVEAVKAALGVPARPVGLALHGCPQAFQK
jgi:UDP-2-acetamido-2-deoxy-ribo-hexuluronate aminotransferase